MTLSRCFCFLLSIVASGQSGADVLVDFDDQSVPPELGWEGDWQLHQGLAHSGLFSLKSPIIKSPPGSIASGEALWMVVDFPHGATMTAALRAEDSEGSLIPGIEVRMEVSGVTGSTRMVLRSNWRVSEPLHIPPGRREVRFLPGVSFSGDDATMSIDSLRFEAFAPSEELTLGLHPAGDLASQHFTAEGAGRSVQAIDIDGDGQAELIHASKVYLSLGQGSIPSGIWTVRKADSATLSPIFSSTAYAGGINDLIAFRAPDGDPRLAIHLNDRIEVRSLSTFEVVGNHVTPHQDPYQNGRQRLELFDVTGDGVPEGFAVFGRNAYGVCYCEIVAFELETGDRLWAYPIDRLPTWIRVKDVFGSGEPSLVTATGLVLSAVTGTRQFEQSGDRWENSVFGRIGVGSGWGFAAVPLDGSRFVLDLATNSSVAGLEAFPLGVLDVEGDGSDELLVRHAGDDNLRAIVAIGGEERADYGNFGNASQLEPESVELGLPGALAWGGHRSVGMLDLVANSNVSVRDHSLLDFTAVGDLDRDGTYEVALVRTEDLGPNKLVVVKADSLEEVWSQELPPAVSRFGMVIDTMSSPAPRVLVGNQVSLNGWLDAFAADGNPLPAIALPPALGTRSLLNALEPNAVVYAEHGSRGVGQIRVVELESGATRWLSQEAPWTTFLSVEAIDLDGDGVQEIVALTGRSSDRTVRAYDAASGSTIWAISVPEASSIAVHPGLGQLFATGGRDNLVDAYEIASGSLLWSVRLPMHRSAMAAVTVEDHELLLVAGGNFALRDIVDVFDLNKGSIIGSYQLPWPGYGSLSRLHVQKDTDGDVVLLSKSLHGFHRLRVGLELGPLVFRDSFEPAPGD